MVEANPGTDVVRLLRHVIDANRRIWAVMLIALVTLSTAYSPINAADTPEGWLCVADKSGTMAQVPVTGKRRLT